MPLFLDQANLTFQNATLEKLAREVCGDNIQCLFDIHTTCKVSIGNATKKTMDLVSGINTELKRPGELRNTITELGLIQTKSSVFCLVVVEKER